jgi:hypothetical protein
MPKHVAAMDGDEVAPVPHHRVQRACLTPSDSSFRTHSNSAQTVHYNVDHDLAVVLLPPESSPPSIPSSP